MFGPLDPSVELAGLLEPLIGPCQGEEDGTQFAPRDLTMAMFQGVDPVTPTQRHRRVCHQRAQAVCNASQARSFRLHGREIWHGTRVTQRGASDLGRATTTRDPWGAPSVCTVRVITCPGFQFVFRADTGHRLAGQMGIRAPQVEFDQTLGGGL